MLPLQSPDARVPGSKRFQSRPNPSDRCPLNVYNGLISALALSHLLRYAVSKLGFSTAFNCSCKFQIFTRPSSLQLAARIPPPIFTRRCSRCFCLRSRRLPLVLLSFSQICQNIQACKRSDNCNDEFSVLRASYSQKSLQNLFKKLIYKVHNLSANDWTAERWDYVVDWYCGGCVGKSAGRACVDQAAAGPLVW
ncbi:hypothetical protein ALC56_14329 [Trachymyrmex septentrionalis]|uniref:Uncharacterized protein n=1 Tax=Trachymyrmex septentrionalis TaxID=34720 RepID=A0A195ET88_9HYME|nr:hypothetical protein ALC56_14329 [Trachymyrmex septentrionalis]